VTLELTKALFQSRTRTALLQAVLRDGVADSLSGLARRTGLSQHAVAVEVKNLAGAGLVRVESVGGADVVQANRDHPAVGPLVRLLSIAAATPQRRADPGLRASLAHLAGPARKGKRRAHPTLETTLARGLAAARREPALLTSVALALLKNRRAVDWASLREEARRLKVKHELVTVVELVAEVSGRAELMAHVADLKDRRRRAVSLVVDDSARAALEAALPASGLSLAATRAAAAERRRLRTMGPAARALLALELGERSSALRRASP
jgi:DNA-binding Lrp family transcriptional regulator